MEFPKISSGSFLGDCWKLISGVDEKDFVKEQILKFNFDKRKLEDIKASLSDADAADLNVIIVMGEKFPTLSSSYDLLEELAGVVYMHFDFLMLILEDDTKKIELGMVKKQYDDTTEWLEQTISVYDRVLSDEPLIENMKTRYNIDKEEIVNIQQTLKHANASRIKLIKENLEADAAVERKKKAFIKLYKEVKELAVVCYHALKKYPKILSELGIPVERMTIFGWN